MKSIIREKMLAKRGQMPENEAKVLSKLICKRLLDNFSMYDSYGLYYSVNNEVELSTFLIDMKRLDERVEDRGIEREFYLPKVIGDDIYFGRYSDDLVGGYKGIHEPHDAIEYELFNDNCNFILDVIVVPGLAFDRRGYRVGYGKGFYDKWFSRYNTQFNCVSHCVIKPAPQYVDRCVDRSDFNTHITFNSDEYEQSKCNAEVSEIKASEINVSKLVGLKTDKDDLSNGFKPLCAGDLIRKVLKIGVCYDWQVVDNIYPLAHDVKMDYIVSESLIIKC